MAVRNLHWYNANESRSYPLDEAATSLSDEGQRLPSNILADLNLRYPGHLGRYAFVSSLSVTPTLVSLTIQATDDLDAVGLSPLAVVSVPLSGLDENRPIAVEGQVPGVGGWVVFGSGVQEIFSGRFSTARQGLLAPRAAKPYRPLPVSSVGKLGSATELTGVVQLRGVDPVQIVSETRTIEGVERDVIVFRLVLSDALEVLGNEINVFDQFAGPCSGRPESETCGDPAPIEFINGVAPDCNGNITLQLQGCATIARVLGQCGVVVDCGLGLVDACVDSRLPAADGTLPNEYPDECDDEKPTGIDVSESDPGPFGPPFTPPPEISESEDIVGELPYLECFNEDTISPHWDVISGAFGFVTDTVHNEPGVCEISTVSESDSVDDTYTGFLGEAYLATSLSQRNISLWRGFDDSTLRRRITTAFKIGTGSPTSGRNAGIIVNHREHPSIRDRFQYFLVQADYNTQTLQVVRFNGSNFVPVSPAIQLPGLQLGRWYTLTVETMEDVGDNVLISVLLESLGNDELSVSLGPVSTSRFLPDTGVNGVHANRSSTRFEYFLLEET
jgi:hypothetical protein